MKAPKRDRDVRIEVTHRVFGELASRFWIRKGTVLDGSLDKDGNFVTVRSTKEYGFSVEEEVTIYPTHFKILGTFVFKRRKV